MSLRSLRYLLILLAAWALSAGAQEVDQQAEGDLVALANQARSEVNAAPLAVDEGLTKAAFAHAELMAQRGKLSHQFPGEPALTERLAASSKLHLDQFGENIGVSDSPQNVHEGFMHSPPHRANLLNPSYNSVGIGVVRRGDDLYVAEDFGRSQRDYSASQAEDRVLASAQRIRADAHLARLGRRGGQGFEADVCNMAKADSVNVHGSTPTQGRAIFRFTATQPEALPKAIADMLPDATIQAIAVGACFARTPSYPSGVYWVVMVVY